MQRLAMAEKEFAKPMDDRIDTMARETDMRMDDLVNQGQDSSGAGRPGAFAGARC